MTQPVSDPYQFEPVGYSDQLEALRSLLDQPPIPTRIVVGPRGYAQLLALFEEGKQ